MSARIKLYHYPSDSRSQAVHLMLRQSELPFELVPLYYCEPSAVVQLTKGNFYGVPVIEDVLMAQVIHELGEGKQNGARHIDSLAQMNLFPETGRGLQQVLTDYVEHECAPLAMKINDAYFDRWLQTDLERGLVRRMREAAFGKGCLEEWLRTIGELQEHFNDRLRPLNLILGDQAFLMGERVTFADYALYGVLREFLHSNATHLSTEFVHLGNWLDKMEGGQFPRGKVGGGESDAESLPGADGADGMDDHDLYDPADVVGIVKELKIGSGRSALVVESSEGRTAVALAKLGLNVTATASDAAHVQATQEAAQAAGVQVRALQQTPDQLPAEGQYDLVVTRMSSRYFGNAQAFLNEAGRVLKMYGYVVVVDVAGLDDHPEVTKWMNEVEGLRESRHKRLVRSNDWRKWCAPLGLKIVKDQPQALPVKDLNWYLDLAHTPQENRTTITERFARAPAAVRELLKISMEGGKVNFLLPKITIVAGKI